MPFDALLPTLEAWTRQLAGCVEVEIVLVWPLTAHEQPGCRQVVILGSPEQVRMRPRDVFGPALAANADGVAIAHAHLSDVGASEHDHAVTRRLVAAGAVLGIPLLTHLLVEPSGTVDLLSGREVARPAA